MRFDSDAEFKERAQRAVVKLQVGVIHLFLALDFGRRARDKKSERTTFLSSLSIG